MSRRQQVPYKVRIDRDLEADEFQVVVSVKWEDIDSLPFGGIPDYFVTRKGNTSTLLQFPENKELLSYQLATWLETVLELEART